MLTVKEINEVSFGKAGFSGYKPEDVDNFIDEVASSFEQLIGERDAAVREAAELSKKNRELAQKNKETQDKLAILAQKIESYRAEEDGIKEAIISAQKMAKTSVQEAKDKAEIILEDAKSAARKMMDEAKTEANKAAQEYMEQAETKKGELEEIKRQVVAFRASLLEMYKKHLECIDHIPVFRVKETAEPKKAEPEKVPEETPFRTPSPVVESKPEEKPEEKSAPQAKKEEIKPEREEKPVHTAENRQEKPEVDRTLHDKVDYSREQMKLDPLEEDDLSQVGIDLNAFTTIPESLQREKDTHFSNLEFGDNVNLGNTKKRKK